MDVTCGNCKAKFKIPDAKVEKIPKGQSMSLPCPKCTEKITIQSPAGGNVGGKSAPKPKAAAPPSPSSAPGGASPDDTAIGSPFDFLEEGTLTAMICEPGDRIRGQLRPVLEGMKYVIAEPKTPRDALKQMRSHDFDLIVVNETFGTPDPDANHVLKYLDQLSMHVRRNIFVALISNRFKTLDNMMTFNKSVNIIINLSDVSNIDKILSKGINEHTAFFRVFKEAKKKFVG